MTVRAKSSSPPPSPTRLSRRPSRRRPSSRPPDTPTPTPTSCGLTTSPAAPQRAQLSNWNILSGRGNCGDAIKHEHEQLVERRRSPQQSTRYHAQQSGSSYTSAAIGRTRFTCSPTAPSRQTSSDARTGALPCVLAGRPTARTGPKAARSTSSSTLVQLEPDDRLLRPARPLDTGQTRTALPKATVHYISARRPVDEASTPTRSSGAPNQIVWTIDGVEYAQATPPASSAGTVGFNNTQSW